MNRRDRSTLALIVVVGFATRLLYLFLVDPTLGPDAIWYRLQAGTIASGAGYVDPDAFYRLGQSISTANFPPLWPTLLAGVDKVGFDSNHAFQLVGVVLGTITIGLTAVLARRMVGGRPGRRVALVAAAIVALSPGLIASDGSLMSESLYVALVLGATIVAVDATRRPTWARFAAMGALFGLAALTRSDGLIVAACVLAAVAWRARGPALARRVGLAAVGGAVVLAVLAPWAIRNSSSLGTFTPTSTNAGSTLEGANCASTYSGPLLGAWDKACLVHTRAEGTTEVEWSAAGRQAAVDYARAHLARLPMVAAVRDLRAFGLWDPAGQTRLDAIESRSYGWQRLAWAYGLAVLVLAVPGAIWLKRRGASLAAPGAVVVATLVIVAISTGYPRFRLVADPILAIAAAGALVAGYQRVRSRG